MKMRTILAWMVLILLLKASSSTASQVISRTDTVSVLSTFDELILSSSSRLYDIELLKKTGIHFESWPLEEICPRRKMAKLLAIQPGVLTQTYFVYQTDDGSIVFQDQDSPLFELKPDDCQQVEAILIPVLDAPPHLFLVCSFNSQVRILEIKNEKIDQKSSLGFLKGDLQIMRTQGAYFIYGLKRPNETGFNCKGILLRFFSSNGVDEWYHQELSLGKESGDCSIEATHLSLLGPFLYNEEKYFGLALVVNQDSKRSLFTCLNVETAVYDCQTAGQLDTVPPESKVLHLYIATTNFSQLIAGVTLGIPYVKDGIQITTEAVFEWRQDIEKDLVKKILVYQGQPTREDCLKSYFYSPSVPFAVKSLLSGLATGYYHQDKLVYVQVRTIETYSKVQANDAFLYPKQSNLTKIAKTNNVVLQLDSCLQVFHFSYPLVLKFLGSSRESSPLVIRWKQIQDWKLGTVIEKEKTINYELKDFNKLVLKKPSINTKPLFFSSSGYDLKVEGLPAAYVQGKFSLACVACSSPESESLLFRLSPQTADSQGWIDHLMFGNEHFTIDLDQCTFLRCSSTRLRSKSISSCSDQTSLGWQGDVDTILPGSRITERFSLLVYRSKPGNLSALLVRLQDGRHWHAASDSRDAAMFSADFAEERDMVKIAFTYQQGQNLVVTHAFSFSANNEAAVQSKSFYTVPHVSGLSVNHYLSDLETLVTYGETVPACLSLAHDGKTNKTTRLFPSIDAPNVQRVSFKGACRLSAFATVLISDSKMSVVINGSQILEFGTEGHKTFGRIHCFDLGWFAVEIGERLLEYDLRQIGGDINAARFEPLREYPIDSDSFTAVPSHDRLLFVPSKKGKGKHHKSMYRPLSQHSAILIPKDVPEAIVRLQQSDSESTSLQLTLQTAKVQGFNQEVTVNATTDLIKPKVTVSMPLASLSSVSKGHILEIRSGDSSLQIIPKVKRLASELNCLAVGCEEGHCWRLHKNDSAHWLTIDNKDGSTASYSLQVVSDSARLSKITLSKAPDDADLLQLGYLIQYHTRSSPYHYTTTLADAGQGKLKALFTHSMSLDFLPNVFDRFLTVDNRTLWLGFDDLRSELSLYFQTTTSTFSTSLYRSDFTSSKLAGIKTYQALPDKAGVLLLYASVGQKELGVGRLSSSTRDIENLKTKFEEMHYYDKFKCIWKQDSLIECLFVGRKINIVRFAISGNIVEVTGEVEEYYAYKNIEPEHLDFNEKTIIVSGSRIVEEDEAGSSYDHAGVFIYNRLGTKNGSPFVRHLISKEDIFETLKTDKYSVVLNSSRLHVHGNLLEAVATYSIGEYAIEGRRLSPRTSWVQRRSRQSYSRDERIKRSVEDSDVQICIPD